MRNTALARLQRLLRVDASARMSADNVGLEKEALRLNAQGRPANTPHPEALGSALTNSFVTTDFSENMLEVTTPVAASSNELLQTLQAILYFTQRHIGEELIAPASMPVAYSEQSIPIARYGSSHSGLLRYYYRCGLAARYGKLMQTIAGLHYNFSFSPEFIQAAHILNPRLSSERLQDHVYFATIRNYQRYSWLMLYLFGASPALDRSFLAQQRTDQLLLPLGRSSLYAPYATSLRMSSIGYSNQNQQNMRVCHNSLHEYLQELQVALEQDNEAYQRLGVRNADGSYRQLNSKQLQIENEYYTSIRPKAPAVRGRRQSSLLAESGIQYLEIRNLDLNPFTHLGVTLEQLNFLRVFVYFCAISNSENFSPDNCISSNSNNSVICKYGLSQRPQLYDNGLVRDIRAWAEQLLDEMTPIAEWLDEGEQLSPHHRALAEQLDKIKNPEKTPAAQIINKLLHDQQDHSEFVVELAQRHRQQLLEKSLDIQPYQQEARRSIIATRELEQQSQSGSFDQYLHNFLHESD